MRTPFILVLIVIVMAAYAIASWRGASSRNRIGVFDSRAVACAWIRSDAFEDELNKIKSRQSQINPSDRHALAKGLEAELVALQERGHQQVFAKAPIDDVLGRIDMPSIAERAGVDLLINKWRIAHQTEAAELVDVTWEMVNSFEPNAETTRVIREIIGMTAQSSLSGRDTQMSRKTLEQVYREFSIETTQSNVADTDLIIIVPRIATELKPTFEDAFLHSLVTAFESNGIEAEVRPESPIEDKPWLEVHITPLHREKQDGSSAIVGCDLKSRLFRSAEHTPSWELSARVDYIKQFGPNYRASDGIIKEFGFHATKALVTAFVSEVNGDLPTEIPVVLEARQALGLVKESY